MKMLFFEFGGSVIRSSMPLPASTDKYSNESEVAISTPKENKRTDTRTFYCRILKKKSVQDTVTRTDDRLLKKFG